MAWNEPGSGNKPREPWHGGGPSPDLDALLTRIRNWYQRRLGGGGGNGIALAALGLVIAWCLFDSWTVINANQAGVVLRFGRFTRTLPPGFNLKWPRPIESVTKVDATSVRTVSDQVSMLTNDQNIVRVHFNVQYNVSDPVEFLFSVRDPDDTLKQASESAVRSVIGASDMDTILSGQRAQLMTDAKKLLQQTIDSYKSGLFVTELNFQDVRPPQEVKDAFDDVIRAKEDRTTAQNEAKAYASKVVPEARGDVARIHNEAEGYKAERIAKAQGEAARFNLVDAEYRAAPEVTRKRLYLETLEKVVGETPKVIDLSAGRNILYLPVGPASSAPSEPAAAATAKEPATHGGSK